MNDVDKELFKTPIFIYLVLASVSALSALLFFHIGGSLAELAGQTEHGFSFKTGGAIAGFLIVFWFSANVIERLYGINSLSGAGAEGESFLPKSYSFPTMLAEISKTIDKLEEDEEHLLKYYVSQGDGKRLFDGLYSSILYASSAAITGQVDSRFYGNMMEWDSNKAQLRVRYFAGPYNDEIITRKFPIDGPGQGVASDVFKSHQIQVKNKMESELKEKGESRLFSMVCVPVSDIDQNIISHQIVIINVDAGVPDVFPAAEDWEISDAKYRLEQLAKLISQVNILYRRNIENT